MKRAFRILAYSAGTLAALVIVAAIGVFAVSEAKLRHKYDVPLHAFAARSDSSSIAEGERLARIRGCLGCHGARLEGTIFFNEPFVGVVPAPNLTQLALQYSDSDLERAIRHGVRQNERSVFAMPSAMFSELADEDLAMILGFIRSRPVVESADAKFSVGPVGRIALVTGMFKPEALTAVGEPPADVPHSNEREWGRYLARTVCTECHGPDLRGDPSGKPPNLSIAAAYSEPDWFRLLRTGRGLGDRDLGLMSRVADSRFSHLTDAEVRALRVYLLEFASSDSARK